MADLLTRFLSADVLTPAEYAPGSIGSSYAVDFASDRQVQVLDAVTSTLEITKGSGWPATGRYAAVKLKLVVVGTPTITWTVADIWTTDIPTGAAGTWYVNLEFIDGDIVASAGLKQV